MSGGDGRYSKHIMQRIVQLTVETNTLTGKCLLSTNSLRLFIPHLLELAWQLFHSCFMRLFRCVKDKYRRGYC